MTQDEIIEMARVWLTEFGIQELCRGVEVEIEIDELEAFAKLVYAKATAKEREACAKVCIDEVWASTVNGTAVEAFNYASKECASRIRARGETTLRGEA